MKETNIQNEIRIEICKHNPQIRLFRNNVGTAWQGSGKPQRTSENCLILKKPRPIKFGLIKGSSDLIGWITTEITPEMVGQKVAVFLALEVKTETGRSSKEQKIFIKNVKQAGGIAGVVRGVDDAKSLIEKCK